MPSLRLLGPIAAVLALLAVLWGAYHHGYETGRAKVQARWDTDLIDRQREHARSLEAARSEEQRRTAEVQKVANEAHDALDRARADAAAAADAGQRLRQRIAAVTAARCAGPGDPAAATAGPAADATADLLADVQRRLDEAADGIARFADATHTAGLACQRSYQTLTRDDHGRD